MRKIILSLVVCAFALTSMGQDGASGKKGKGKRKQVGTWTKGGIFNVGIAQGGSSNWVAGAEKFSLSVNGFLNLYANRVAGKNTWDNQLTASYGMLNTESQGVRKIDDRLDLYSKWGRAVSKKFSIAAVGNFRTQFSDGYDYNYLGNGLRRRISGLFAPATVIIAPGAEWKPCKDFSAFLSPISARWFIVTNAPYSYYYDATNGQKPDGTIETPLSQFYNVDPGKQVRFEAGAFASINYRKQLCKGLTYVGRADVYADYLSRRPDNMDVFMTNTFVWKVNKFISLNYSLDVVYDDDQKQVKPDGKVGNTVGTQVRSLLGVGFSTKF